MLKPLAGSCAAVATLTLCLVPSASAAVGPSPGLPDRDARTAKRTAAPAATAKARRSFARRLGPDAAVDSSRTSGALHLLQRTDAMLTGPSGADPKAIALDYVRAHADVFDLDAGDLAALRLDQEDRSPDGLRHLTWDQTVDGIRVYGAQLEAHLDSDGRLASFSGDPRGDLTLGSTIPKLDAAAAKARAAALAGGRPGGTAKPRLVAFPVGGSTRLAWAVTASGAAPYTYEIVLDAASGDLLRRRNLTEFANARVWERFPGAPGGGGTAALQQIDRDRWLNDSAGGTRLYGNNARLYSDVDGDDVNDGAGENVATSNGADWDFPQNTAAFAGTCAGTGCSWNPAVPSTYTTNRAQNAAQVFYFVNRFHDHLAAAPIGFDEAGKNFQTDNGTAGGLGGDAVITEPDDTAALPVTAAGDQPTLQLNNANMTTPVDDGEPPRMQMYLFAPTPNNPFLAVNGGDAADIVYHEYTHGLSSRLVADLDNLEGGAMGEAWSDWYAFDFLNSGGYAPDTATPGELNEGEPYLSGAPAAHLIRTEPIDCPVGAAGPACPGTPSAGAGGYTYGDVGNIVDPNAFEVHADGEVWGQTLWDLRTAVGTNVARSLVTGGMRLSPRSPGFLESRDAILQQDAAAFGGVHIATIWSVFAARGMGYNASFGTEDFSLPPAFDRPRPAVDDAAPLGDGDGALEPGEAARLGLTARNLGAAIANPLATLTSSDAGAVSVIKESAAFTGPWAGNADATTATPFVVTVPATATCATTLPLSVGVGDGSLNPGVTLGALGAPTVTNATGLPKPIADPDSFGSPVQTQSAITVPAGAGPVSKLQIGLSATHTWDSDLIIVVTHNGRTATLVNSRTTAHDPDDATNDNFTGTVFSDAAGTAIGAGTAPFTGSFRPESPLSAFDGTDAAGVWTLRLYDQFEEDAGQLTAWSVRVPARTCSAPTSQLPAADTSAPTSIAATAARLAGVVDPRGTATAAAFELGPTTAYGATIAAGDAGAGTGGAAVGADATGLTPSTTYHYRTLALRGGTTIAVGPDRTFVTTATSIVKPPDVTPTDPAVSLLRSTKAVRLTSRRSFTYLFRARAGAKGKITFVTVRRITTGKGKTRKSRRVTLKTLNWTANKAGNVRLKVTLNPVNAALVKRLKAVPTTVTVTSGAKRYTAKLTIRPAKAPVKKKKKAVAKRG